MKHIFYFLFFIFALTGIASVDAIGFSPSSLDFDLSLGEENCQDIILDSNSAIIEVSDKWAENLDVEWKVTLFNQTSDFHGLSINYDDKLNFGENELEVCLSGIEVGEYHGAIIMEEQKQGNSVIKMAVWLKVVIGEEVEEAVVEDNRESSGSSSSSGGGSGGGLSSGEDLSVNVNIVVEDNSSASSSGVVGITILESEGDGESESGVGLESVGITGGVVGGSGVFGKWGIIFAVALVGGLVGMLAYSKRRKIL